MCEASQLTRVCVLTHGEQKRWGWWVGGSAALKGEENRKREKRGNSSEQLVGGMT